MLNLMTTQHWITNICLVSSFGRIMSAAQLRSTRPRLASLLQLHRIQLILLPYISKIATSSLSWIIHNNLQESLPASGQLDRVLARSITSEILRPTLSCLPQTTQPCSSLLRTRCNQTNSSNFRRLSRQPTPFN